MILAEDVHAMKYPAQMRLTMSEAMKAQVDAQPNSQQFVRDAIDAVLSGGEAAPQPQRRPGTPPKPAQVSDLPPNAKLLLAHLRKRGGCTRRDVMRALSWGEEQLLPAVVSLRGMIRTKGDMLGLIE